MGVITGQFSVYWHSHELKAGAMRTKPPSAPEGPNVLPPHCQYMVWPRRFFLHWVQGEGQGNTGFGTRTG